MVRRVRKRSVTILISSILIISLAAFLAGARERRLLVRETQRLSALIARSLWTYDDQDIRIIGGEFLRNEPYAAIQVWEDTGDLFIEIANADPFGIPFDTKKWPVKERTQEISFQDTVIGKIKVMRYTTAPQIALQAAIVTVVMAIIAWLAGDRSENRRRRKSAEKKLKDFEEMKALSNITVRFAHEMNTPIGNIKLALTEISRIHEMMPANSEVLSGLVDFALRQNEHLIDTTARIRRADPMHSNESLVITDLNALASEFLKKDFPPSVKLTVRTRVEPLWVKTYPTILSDVITELLENGSKYGRSDDGMAHMLIQVEGDADQYRISVSDSGPGIPEEVRPYIFKQMEMPFSSKLELALGLHIVWSSVTRNLGGDISFQTSEEGSSFTLAGPLELSPKTNGPDLDDEIEWPENLPQ